MTTTTSSTTESQSDVADASEGPGLHLLHVEDERSFAELTQRFLEQLLDCEVTHVPNPEDALEYLGSTEVDCVISDYNMPQMDGIEFLSRVRQHWPDLPFILLTGRGSEEVASEAISEGVTDYLQKGGGKDNFQVLANRIDNVVSQYRAEQEIDRTRLWYQTILEHASDFDEPSDFVMIVDDQARIEFVSPAVEPVLGYTPDELEGEPGFDRIHPDDVDDAEEAFAETIEQPDAERVAKFRYRHRDGSWRWLEVRALNLLDDDVIDGLMVNVQDQTELRDQEREIEETRYQYQQILEHSSDYVMIVDGAGDVAYISPAVERVLGYDPDEIVGQKSFEYIHPDDLESAVTTFGEIIEEPDREMSVEFRAQHEDGSWRWLETRGRSYLDDPVIEGILVNVRDITERKKREQEIEETRHRYEMILSHSSDYVMIVDPSGEVTYVSPAINRVLGYEPDDIIGSTSLEFVHPEDVDHAVETLGHVIENPDDEVTAELRAQHADGSWRWLETRGGNQLDDPAIEGIMVNVRDITERKRETKRLQQLTKFVSHDITNLLTVVYGNLQLVSLDIEDERLETAVEAVDRVIDMIEQIGELAEEGEITKDPEPVDLAEVAKRCSRYTEVDLDVESDVTVVADDGQLQSLLENLFINASSHGGARTVRVGALDGDTHGFYVEDDGDGFPGDAEKIFDIGYSTSETGSGLGLAIVDEVANFHGWSIAVDELDEGGVRFAFHVREYS